MNVAPAEFEETLLESETLLRDRREASRLIRATRRLAIQHFDELLGVWESLQTLVRLLRCKLAGRFDVPDSTAVMALAALIYFLNPFDLIPDAIPVLGWVDDAAVITFVVKLNLREISRFRNWEFSRRNGIRLRKRSVQV